MGGDPNNRKPRRSKCLNESTEPTLLPQHLNCFLHVAPTDWTVLSTVGSPQARCKLESVVNGGPLNSTSLSSGTCRFGKTHAIKTNRSKSFEGTLQADRELLDEITREEYRVNTPSVRTLTFVPRISTSMKFSVSHLLSCIGITLKKLASALRVFFFWFLCCFGTHAIPSPLQSTRFTDDLLLAILRTPFLYILCYEIRPRSQEGRKRRKTYSRKKKKQKNWSGCGNHAMKSSSKRRRCQPSSYTRDATWFSRNMFLERGLPPRKLQDQFNSGAIVEMTGLV